MLGWRSRRSMRVIEIFHQLPNRGSRYTAVFRILFGRALGNQLYHAIRLGSTSMLRCHLQRASNAATGSQERKRDGGRTV
jgi:hypothetical protein